MSIESLKQQARRHEQKEEWQKALDQYNKALVELAREEQVDIGLYNRVGDLYVRTGALDSAVEHYEKAIDLYREAYLPNNAIAVCKKIIRNVPDRHTPYLRIGQIRAEQGFLPDARTNFLLYAERMQQSGDLDESFRALIEFCDLAPEDVGVRVTVADQMGVNGRTDEAVEQLMIARQHFAAAGESSQTEELENKILALDPEADLSAVPAAMEAFGSSVGVDGEIVADFGDISLGDSGQAEPEFAGFGASDGEAAGGSGSGDFELSSGDSAEVEIEMPDVDFATEDDDEEAVELPMMGFGDATAEEEEEEVVELPTMDFGDDAADGEAVELPTMEFGEQVDADEEEAEPLPTMQFGDAAEADEDAVELPTMDFAATDQVSETVEEAVEEAAADSFVEEPVAFVDEPTPGVEEVEVEESAPAVDEPTLMADPEPVVDQVPAEEEVAPEPPAAPAQTDFVDFGAMILGGDEEKSTRFTVAYEEPSGDEEADFAKMLSQFKEKVSENLDTSDVRAHYDLGTAYKEMGLLDEAISSFQAALRASADHLPTYEVMGQTFIEMGQAEAAVNSLQRALEVDSGVEDDLVGIYYYLARAYETLEQKDSAVEFYDKVFALDINFADVTERLRELR